MIRPAYLAGLNRPCLRRGHARPFAAHWTGLKHTTCSATIATSNTINSPSSNITRSAVAPRGKTVSSTSSRGNHSAAGPAPSEVSPSRSPSAKLPSLSSRDLPRPGANKRKATANSAPLPPPLCDFGRPGEMAGLGKAMYAVGFWIRETGQALDRFGCRLQGNYFFHEQLSRHRTLMNIFDKAPHVHKDAFVAPSASLIGDVQVGHGSSIWYGCVLRGDANNIQIGSGTNIQDNSLVHVAKSNLSGKVFPTIIGDNVTVGHSAVLQGCTVEDEAFVGMGATLLDGVVVEKHGMAAAGALVRQNTRIPSGEVWGGNPAKFLRKLTDEEIAFIAESAANYSNLAKAHAVENAKPLEKIEFEKVLRKKFARQGEYDSMIGVTREAPPELTPPNPAQ